MKFTTSAIATLAAFAAGAISASGTSCNKLDILMSTGSTRFELWLLGWCGRVAFECDLKAVRIKHFNDKKWQLKCKKWRWKKKIYTMKEDSIWNICWRYLCNCFQELIGGTPITITLSANYHLTFFKTTHNFLLFNGQPSLLPVLLSWAHVLLPTVLSLLDALVLPVLILMQPTAFVDRVSAPIL